MKNLRKHIKNLDRISLKIFKAGIIAVTGVLLYIDSYIIESRQVGIFNMDFTLRMLECAATSLTLVIAGALIIDLCRKKYGSKK